MEDEKVLQYSWGEFYETLKGMKESGDDPCDILFEKAAKVFEKMDKAKTQKEVRDILYKNDDFTELELNRLNSKLFDGLILADDTMLNTSCSSLLEGLVTASRITEPYIETYKFLLSKTSERDMDKNFFIYKTTIRGIVEYLKIFLQVYPKIDIKELLIDSCEYDHYDIVKFLLTNYPQLRSSSKYYTWLPACLCKITNDKRIVELLFENFDEIDEMICIGCMYQNICKGKDEIAAVFAKKIQQPVQIQFIIDAESPDKYPLCIETLIICIEKGGLLPSTVSGLSMLNWAIQHTKNIELVKALLNRGVEPDNFTEEIAIEYGMRDALQYELARRERQKSIGS